MNILLVRPMPHKESIGLQSFMICEPLELEYLSALLEPMGHSVTIIDMILEKKPLSYFLSKFVPDVVGFTGYITHVGVIRQYAQSVKSYDARVVTVAGGIHAEVVPEDFLDDALDLIVHANGLATFQAILGALKTQQSIEQIKENIPGVWNGKEKQYPSLDETFDFPHPDRGKTDRYRRHYNYIFQNRCATLKTSFGCPYQCDFCFCVEITRHRYFERDLDDVILELKGIQEKNIFIVDDCFLLKPERVLKFCDLLEQEGICKNFILFGRADFITQHPEVIRRFRAQGLQAVFMGLESFREKELESLNKQLVVQDNVDALRVLEENNVECHCGIVVQPDWEREDFDFLIQWLARFKMVFVNIQPLTPMPGTPLYDRSKERISVDRNQFPKWDMAHLLFEPEKLSRRQFYGNILRAYYHTSIGVRAHCYIARKYGWKTYFRTSFGALYITWQYIKMWIRG